MLETSRRLSAFRKSIVKMLTEQFGYTYINKRNSRRKSVSMNSWLDGPAPEDFMLLADLERINTGEAHYRVDFPCAIIDSLGTDLARPKYMARRPKPTREEILGRYFQYLYCGWEFKIKRGQCGYDYKKGGKEQYDIVQIINWLAPELNSFTVYENWRGVKNDGVAWDLIISVNHIPVVAVMTAPTTEGHRPCEEAYAEMRRQLDADPRLDTYLLCCIISDGKTTLVGSPDDRAEWFFPWDPCKQTCNEAKQAGVRRALLPFFALLEKKRLIAFLHAFVHLVGEDEPLRYVATSHQYEAVLAAARHFISGQGAAYVVLPEPENTIRAYPFETNYNTSRELFIDYVSLRGILDDRVEDDLPEEEKPRMSFVVEPQLSHKVHEGKCVYRPKSPLKSPMVD